jgi:coenzyme F420-reducing hydrogenase gamma subunit
MMGNVTRPKPRLAVYKFASCDGCQLTILDCEDELLPLAREIEIAYLPEARRQVLDGPYDLVLVEGSVTTPEEEARIREVRQQAKVLVTIGACATAGGIQALRNWADVREFAATVYPSPEYIQTLAHARPISDFVKVDFELRGCPIHKAQLLELVTALLVGRKPRVPTHSVCLECKLRGIVCVMVARGTPCLGPVTQAGCGAICPAYNRGCYGCFGPMEQPNASALGQKFLELGLTRPAVSRAFRLFTAGAPAFHRASEDFSEE